MRMFLAIGLLFAATAFAQNKFAPLPDAPTEACAFDKAPADTPMRFLTGVAEIPYQFACGHNRPAGVCVGSTLKPGIVVSLLGPEKAGWTCVTGGDTTSGWVPADRMGPVPERPRIPLKDWLGWWRVGPPLHGMADNRLLITSGVRPGTLHISGRAYWYGINDNVHFGEIRTDQVITIGPYLHAVEGEDLSGCVLDLKYDLAAHKFDAFDNAACGGMNVRFAGTWQRFTPVKANRKRAAYQPQ